MEWEGWRCLWLKILAIFPAILSMTSTSSTKVSRYDTNHTCWLPFKDKFVHHEKPPLYDVFQYTPAQNGSEMVCLYLSMRPASYNDSVTQCSNIGERHDVHLVMIKDEHKNQFLVDTVMAYDASRLQNGTWIGLKWKYWLDIGWSWRWLDDDPLQWAYGWIPETKTRFSTSSETVCALLKRNEPVWQWKFCDYYRLLYICEWQVPEFSPKGDTSTQITYGTDQPWTQPNGAASGRAHDDGIKPDQGAADPGDGQEGDHLGVYVGIAVGAVVGAAVALVLVVIAVRRKRKAGSDKASSSDSDVISKQGTLSKRPPQFTNGRKLTADDIMLVRDPSDENCLYETIPEDHIQSRDTNGHLGAVKPTGKTKSPDLSTIGSLESYLAPRPSDGYEYAKPAGLYQEVDSDVTPCQSPQSSSSSKKDQCLSDIYEDIENIKRSSSGCGQQGECSPLLEKPDGMTKSEAEIGDGDGSDEYAEPSKKKSTGFQGKDEEVTIVENDLYC